MRADPRQGETLTLARAAENFAAGLGHLCSVGGEEMGEGLKLELGIPPDYEDLEFAA